MGAPQLMEETLRVIEGGTPLGDPAKIIQFTSDNGAKTWSTVQQSAKGGNGTGYNYWVVAFVTLIQEVRTAVSAGAAMLTMEVGAAGLFIAPALGMVTGAALYEIAPGFWDTLAGYLYNAGETINGKVVAYINKHGKVSFDESVIEAYKKALLEYDAFRTASAAGFTYKYVPYTPVYNYTVPMVFSSIVSRDTNTYYEDQSWYSTMHERISSSGHMVAIKYNMGNSNYFSIIAVGDENDGYVRTEETIYADQDPTTISDGGLIKDIHGAGSIVINDITYYYAAIESGLETNPPHWDGYLFANICNTSALSYASGVAEVVARDIANYIYNNMYSDLTENPNLQEGATYPDEDPFPLRYPQWYPYEFPIIDPEGTPQQLPSTYPVEYPDELPQEQPYQDPAQNPEMPTVPDDFVRIFEDPDNYPDTPVYPEPGPVIPDPDPVIPDPDPIDPTPVPVVDPDPIDPNPEPEPTPPIPVPPLPATVGSNKLFTVYNPTSSQLDSLGAYLWDASIIAAIRDIWQEPLDGVISLMQVYATPITSGSHNIILGFLDSGVSSAVVSSQFVTIDCGTVDIEEDKNNSTDYAPYTSIHLYLPFIGIVELDTNECMDSKMNVKYKVDVYTGTCLATVSIRRTKDMPNSPILYTFNGNCSQQIPLTSGNATGILQALVGGITAGISVASGGGMSALAGAQLLGNSITHDMLHVSHSGNISANAGIMGNKKPYVIIGRRHCYDANNYSRYYGYPSNKTITLGNHSGFMRVKSCWLKTKATQDEYEEIMRLLSEGVFI